ncbi:MAG: NTP transferase domain-containing protein [Acidobacteriales bacterium]|nr:NTP transferase domain-containing protein [Terriglobales bacterium]
MLPVAILAGGRGTRLRPLTETLPKSLVELNGEPFIAHQLRLLRESGIDRVVLCVGILGQMIADFVGNGKSFGLDVQYSFAGSELLGTAGALKRALPVLGGQFFVLYGDSYLVCPYRDIEKSFLSCGKAALMTVFRNEGKWGSSNVEYADGRILAYDKTRSTPRMHHIDYGLGVFLDCAFKSSPQQDLSGVYGDLINSQQLVAFEVHERFYEIGSPEGLAETATFIRSRRGGQR